MEPCSDNKFMFFSSLNRGQCSRYDPDLIYIIFRKVMEFFPSGKYDIPDSFSLLPEIRQHLKRQHIYMDRRALEAIICEITSFIRDEPDIANFHDIMKTVLSCLQKKLYPVLLRVDEPRLLKILTADILLEWKIGIKYSAPEYTEKICSCGAYGALYYYELRDIVDSIFDKLSEMKIIS